MRDSPKPMDLARTRAAELKLVETPGLLACLALSDQAYTWLRRHPEWANTLCDPPGLPLGVISAADLAQFRVRRSLAQIALECSGQISIEASLRYASETAEQCIARALQQADVEQVERFGHAQAADGSALKLVVFGMGKLGGGELNFSSDIDLIMSFRQMGDTTGPRVLDHQEFFARVTRRTAQLLSWLTEFGQCYRVDLRLRPFGSAGQAALSFSAMEDYYQREGRDWERYAWIKARVVAGPEQDGLDLQSRLRPFVYRRYLDFAAFEGMREMKALVDAQVRAEGMQGNLKLGAGGIREIEFLVQMEQLIRGGRDAKLRVAGTLDALQALREADALTPADTDQLRADYLFLRRVENRVQMLGDQQTHELPNELNLQARIAHSLQLNSVEQLHQQIEQTRQRVHQRFAESVQLPRSTVSGSDNAVSQQTGALNDAQFVWQTISSPQADAADKPNAMSAELWQALRGFAESSAVQNQSARGRQRLDRVVPKLWEFASLEQNPEQVCLRLIEFLSAISQRSAYLALLAEKPSVAQRLVHLFASSAWVAQLITATPILLDELIDARRLSLVHDLQTIQAAASAELASMETDDIEAVFERLISLKHSVQLNVATQFLAGTIDALQAVRIQTHLADVMLQQALQMAWREMHRQFGAPAEINQGFVVLGYGSLGGCELNFASDLDLVFLYDDTLAMLETRGLKSIDGQRFFARLAQRIISLLTTSTRFGALYTVDMRLRPNGNKGLLVSGVDAFAKYQLAEAWSWEHQALVRARFVCGDANLGRQFQYVRRSVLSTPRDKRVVYEKVTAMRERMRSELDRSDAESFDLKQGCGGLVDLEFATQAMVLSEPSQVIEKTETAILLASLPKSVFEGMPSGFTVLEWHRQLLDLGLRQTLKREPRLVKRAWLSQIQHRSGH